MIICYAAKAGTRQGTSRTLTPVAVCAGCKCELHRSLFDPTEHGVTTDALTTLRRVVCICRAHEQSGCNEPNVDLVETSTRHKVEVQVTIPIAVHRPGRVLSIVHFLRESNTNRKGRYEKYLSLLFLV